MNTPRPSAGPIKLRHGAAQKNDLYVPEPRKEIAVTDLPLECCGKCISWQLEAARQQDKFSFPVAQCRRFPGQIVVIPTPIPEHELDKLRLDPQIGQLIARGQLPMKQSPVPMQIIKAADDWCREFEPRPAPPIPFDASGHNVP